MVFVTGDTHAEFDRFEQFAIDEPMSRDDIVIVLGDFGGIWHDNKYERESLGFLAGLPYTICFVDGNHENFDRLLSDEFPDTKFHGGRAKQIRDNIFYLRRGEIFDFEGRKFFAMGGASSHDIWDGIIDPSKYRSADAALRIIEKWNAEGRVFRIKGISWWPEEIPSPEVLNYAERTLRTANMRVDYVLSHCLPNSINAMLGYRNPDRLTDWFQKMVDDGLEFDAWFSGHLHRNEYGILGKYNVLYRRIERVL